MVAKRAAVTRFLWDRYTEHPSMSLELLELWHYIENLDALLKPPTWFRNQHRHGNIMELWRAHVGEQQMQHREAQHREVSAKIHTLLAKKR
jgi:hypothetical protein